MGMSLQSSDQGKRLRKVDWEGIRNEQRGKLNCDAVSAKASADSIGGAGTGRALPSRLELRQETGSSDPFAIKR